MIIAVGNSPKIIVLSTTIGHSLHLKRCIRLLESATRSVEKYLFIEQMHASA